MKKEIKEIFMDILEREEAWENVMVIVDQIL